MCSLRTSLCTNTILGLTFDCRVRAHGRNPLEALDSLVIELTHDFLGDRRVWLIKWSERTTLPVSDENAYAVQTESTDRAIWGEAAFRFDADAIRNTDAFSAYLRAVRTEERVLVARTAWWGLKRHALYRYRRTLSGCGLGRGNTTGGPSLTAPH